VPPATPETCRVAVLVGAQLERALGGAVRATEHRVLATSQGANVPRYSVALSFAPATTPSSIPSTCLSSKYAAIVSPKKGFSIYVRICEEVASQCLSDVSVH